MLLTLLDERTSESLATVEFPSARFSNACNDKHEGSVDAGSFASTAVIASDNAGVSSERGKLRRVSTCLRPRSFEQSLFINLPVGVAEE